MYRFVFDLDHLKSNYFYYPELRSDHVHECNGDDKGENVEPVDNDVIENIEFEEEIDTYVKEILVEEDTLF